MRCWNCGRPSKSNWFETTKNLISLAILGYGLYNAYKLSQSEKAQDFQVRVVDAVKANLIATGNSGLGKIIANSLN